MKQPDFNYYQNIADLITPILGGEDSIKSELGDLVKESKEYIESLKARIEELENPWVSVLEKEPKEGQEVIYYYEDIGVFSGRYQNGYFISKKGFIGGVDILWVPKPRINYNREVGRMVEKLNLPDGAWFTEISGWHRVRIKTNTSDNEEIGCGNSKEEALAEAWEWVTKNSNH